MGRCVIVKNSLAVLTRRHWSPDQRLANRKDAGAETGHVRDANMKNKRT